MWNIKTNNAETNLNIFRYIDRVSFRFFRFIFRKIQSPNIYGESRNGFFQLFDEVLGAILACVKKYCGDGSSCCVSAPHPKDAGKIACGVCQNHAGDLGQSDLKFMNVHDQYLLKGA
jgi:hypothetical protein